MSDKTPADVLGEAADLLLIHGRCRGEGSEEDGRFCVLGAMAEAVHPGWVEDDPNYFQVVEANDAANRAMRALDRHLALDIDRLPGYMLSLPDLRVAHWNDGLRSEDDDFEVIDTLRHVAKDLRNEAKS